MSRVGVAIMKAISWVEEVSRAGSSGLLRMIVEMLSEGALLIKRALRYPSWAGGR